MKATLNFFLALSMLFFTACAGQPPTSVQSTTPSVEFSSTTSQSNHIQDLLEMCQIKPESTRFLQECTTTIFDGYTVYSSLELANLPAFLIERTDGSALYVTAPTNSSITGISIANEEVLTVYTDGIVHGGDEIMYNGPGSFSVNLTSGEVTNQTNSSLVFPEGMYGRQYTGDRYEFAKCTVKGNGVEFSFKPCEENAAWKGTELYFSPSFKDQVESERHLAILFNETTAFDMQLVAQIQNIPGVIKVTFSEVNTPYYSGTVLELTSDPSYVVYHSFNDGIAGEVLEKYTITFKGSV